MQNFIFVKNFTLDLFDGIQIERKKLFPSHILPFFSHVTTAMLLQKGKMWLKIAEFSP